jgi:hypothetical protein
MNKYHNAGEKEMPRDRSFWIMARIAVFESYIIIGLLMYILQLNSVIRPAYTVPLASIFGLIVIVSFLIVERKYKKIPQD